MKRRGERRREKKKREGNEGGKRQFNKRDRKKGRHIGVLQKGIGKVMKKEEEKEGIRKSKTDFSTEGKRDEETVGKGSVEEETTKERRGGTKN